MSYLERGGYIKHSKKNQSPQLVFRHFVYPLQIKYLSVYIEPGKPSSNRRLSRTYVKTCFLLDP